METHGRKQADLGHYRISISGPGADSEFCAQVFVLEKA